MSNLFRLILLIGISSIFGQNKIQISKSDTTYTLSVYEKFDTAKEGKILRDLYILDEKAKIISLNSGKKIIFNGNSCFTARPTNSGRHKIEKVSKKLKLIYKKIFDSLKYINPAKLKEITKQNGEQLNIQDGYDRKIIIFKGDSKLVLESYSDEDYIKFGVLHSNERQKFMQFYDTLNKTFFDTKYYNVKKQDTLYVLFKKSKYQLKNFSVQQKSSATTGLIDYHFLTKYPMSNFFLTFINSDKNEKIVFEKKFLTQNKSKILDFNFFENYDAAESYDVLKNKVVYLIDNDDIKYNTITIKKVRVSSCCCFD